MHCIHRCIWIDHIDRSISTDGCSRVVVRTQYIAIIVPKEGDQYTHNAHTRWAARWGTNLADSGGGGTTYYCLLAQQCKLKVKIFNSPYLLYFCLSAGCKLQVFVCVCSPFIYTGSDMHDRFLIVSVHTACIHDRSVYICKACKLDCHSCVMVQLLTCWWSIIHILWVITCWWM